MLPGNREEMMVRTIRYKDHLMELLQDPEEAAAYLNATLQSGDREGFLLAIRDVADVHGGMSWLADETDLRRESLYRTLSRRGNPRLSSLTAVLEAVGLEVSIQPVGKKAKGPSKRVGAKGRRSGRGAGGDQKRC